MTDKPIFVSRPFIPSLEEFIPYLEEIWESKQLTNGGQMHDRLEAALCQYLGVPAISLFSSGTTALLVALKALNISGKVITTPYSFVATSHALLWQGLEPVFVDVQRDTLNIDPRAIEAAITSETRAILAVHCYGTPCETGEIARLAEKYNLKVVYDAAHAFGVQDGGGSLLRHGDLSVLSFHATKVFSTLEGGAIVCRDMETKRKIDLLKNFGIADETTVVSMGINGKLNEISSAFGLTQLGHIDELINQRRKVAEFYRREINRINGLVSLDIPEGVRSNYGYFPIFVTEKYPLSRNELYLKLKNHSILARRYFYPLIADFNIYRNQPIATRHDISVARKAADQVICLPIFPGLTAEDQRRIVSLLAYSI